MPSFNILKTHAANRSFRVQSVIDLFTLQNGNEITEIFQGNIPIENKEWNIGVIVGASGSGKTTIAKDCFGDFIVGSFNYTNTAVIDDMPKQFSSTQIGEVFTSVGFASPPSWLKSYQILSNGEKMRVDLARAILEIGDFFVFDEFTSVIDRQVAKTGSIAIAKAVRKRNSKFVAVTCHRDIVEYLQPDWIYDTDSKEFFFIQSNYRDQKLNSKFSPFHTAIEKEFGEFLVSITI